MTDASTCMNTPQLCWICPLSEM